MMEALAARLAGGLRAAHRWAYRWSESACKRIVLPAGLFVAYFGGMGLAWLLAGAARLGPRRNRRDDENTAWRKAEGYAPDEEDCLRQS
jgi:hypothetical protein